MSDKPPVEIRPDDKGGIDEIVAKNCTVHVERMDAGLWYLGVTASDGSLWQFWFGSANRRTRVDFSHHEMTFANPRRPLP